MRWVLVVSFLLALGLNLGLWGRMRSERLERRRWKGFQADGPDDLTGLEQFERNRYTPTGQRLYPWFVASTVVLLALFIAVFATIAVGE